MFNAERVKNDLVDWVRNWFRDNGNDCSAIIGISGGKDSTVAAALCCAALGKDRVIGVFMPNGYQSDIDVSRAVVEYLGIKSYEINIGAAYNEIIARLQYSSIDISKQTEINLPARLRMSTLYAVSQSMNGRVVNTCNYSEDYVGYSTRYGDSVGDFSPFANLTTEEVIEIGQTLCVPDEFLLKTPSDGLCGKTDEDNLGFTYHELNQYIRYGELPSPTIKKRIDEMHEKNLFKLQLMPSFPYNPTSEF